MCKAYQQIFFIARKKTEEGYAVWVPGLPGCWLQGQTEEEALENIKDAIQAYLYKRQYYFYFTPKIELDSHLNFSKKKVVV